VTLETYLSRTSLATLKHTSLLGEAGDGGDEVAGSVDEENEIAEDGDEENEIAEDGDEENEVAEDRNDEDEQGENEENDEEGEIVVRVISRPSSPKRPRLDLEPERPIHDRAGDSECLQEMRIDLRQNLEEAVPDSHGQANYTRFLRLLEEIQQPNDSRETEALFLSGPEAREKGSQVQEDRGATY